MQAFYKEEASGSHVQGPASCFRPSRGPPASGAWRGFLEFPTGSTSDVHTHSSDLRLVAASGTFCYGADPGHEQPFGPGSYAFIPANHPHSNSQPDGAVVYVEQPGKYDRQGGGQ